MKTRLLIYLAPVLVLGAFFFYYFQPSRHYGARFPIDFIPNTNQPRTEVTIEGHKYPLMIDLGSSSSLTLKTDVLEGIDKISTGFTRSYDIKGNEYGSRTYLLPEIRIRNMVISKVEVIDEGEDFLTKGSVIYSGTMKDETQRKLGRIGRELFVHGNANLLLDFPHSVMFACCHLNDRRKDGYRMDRCVSAPFELSRAEGIVLRIDTDLGVKRFMLDTGATRSFLNSSPVNFPGAKEWKPGLFEYHSAKFRFEGRDFGGVDLLLVEMHSFFKGLDGVIGMDFLRKHVVYIDFDQKRLYLGNPDECHPD